MVSPPPSPPSPPSTRSTTPQPTHGLPLPPNQIVVAKQGRPWLSSDVEAPKFDSKRIKGPILPPPQEDRTNPIVWCGAILCLIFSLILILSGIATLIIYLAIKPRNPVFDTPNANLNSIYFDSPQYFNGDLTFLVNFSNPNRKIDLRFEYIHLELYFFDRFVGTQALQPFTQRRRGTRLESIHIISSLVFLPQNLGIELQKQVLSNRVIYNLRGTFRVKATLGLFHYSYWLHGRCEIEMMGPPTGVLVARSCKIKR